jgi:hypothetical protein
MPNNPIARQKINLVTLFLAIGLLPPGLLIFNKPEWWKGFPLLYAYIFFIWVLYILVTALLGRKTDN